MMGKNDQQSMRCEIIETTAVKRDEIDLGKTVFKIKSANVMDLDRTDDLWLFVQTIIAGGARKLIVDMHDLDFIDSYGIGTLINTAKLIRSLDGEIVIINVSDRIENIFKPINLNRFIKIFNGEEEAVSLYRALM